MLHSLEEMPLGTEKQSLPGSWFGRTFWKEIYQELLELQFAFIGGRADTKNKGQHRAGGAGTFLDLDYERGYTMCAHQKPTWVNFILCEESQ